MGRRMALPCLGLKTGRSYRRCCFTAQILMRRRLCTRLRPSGLLQQSCPTVTSITQLPRSTAAAAAWWLR